MKPCVVMMLLVFPLFAQEADQSPQPKPDLFVNLLGEQLSGEVEDYKNASPEWQLIMEARIRYVMFTYWVNIEKFKVPRNEMIEVRFGKLVGAVEEKGAFKRTFVEPHFIASAKSFPKHAYKSVTGDRFEINSAEQFSAENKKFLEFLEACAMKAR